MIETLNELLPMGTFTGELGRSLLVFLWIASLLTISEIWYRTLSPPVEWARKFDHITAGASLAFFPWIFGSIWSPLLFYLLIGAFIKIGEQTKMLQSIYGVERKNKGDDFFIIAYYLMFVIARHDPFYYFATGMVLTFSDSIAAIVGHGWGKYKYAVERDHKSLEGSLACFVMTNVLIFLIFWGLAGTSVTQALLLGLLIGLVTTATESIGPHGSDNLIIPFSVLYIFYNFTDASVPVLAEQIIVFIALMATVGFFAFITSSLAVSGAVTMQLVLYTMYTIGGVVWLIPLLFTCLAFFVLYGIFRKTTTRESVKDHGLMVKRVGLMMSLPLMIILAYYVTGIYREITGPETELFYSTFAGSVALSGSLAISRTASYFRNLPNKAFFPLILGSIVSILVVLFGVFWVDKEILTQMLTWFIVAGGFIPMVQYLFRQDFSSPE